MTLNTTSTDTEIQNLGIEPEFTVRPARMDDLENAFELFKVHFLEDFGACGQTIEQQRIEWQMPSFDLNVSTQAVFNKDGKMIAYVEVWDTHQVPVRPYVWGFVHPDYRGRGIGTALLRWAEQRARQVEKRVPEDARIVMQSSAASDNDSTNALLKAMGMVHARNGLSMAIEMTEAPPAPEWPEGITITTKAEFNDLRAIYLAQCEAFRDHRGYVEEDPDRGFERWSHWVNNDQKHDPSLWFLAMKDGEIAGMSLCEKEAWDDPTWSYVENLGVLRPYRKQGLGLALLRHTFNVFWSKGQSKVSLHVDGTSLTGATRLYERAGMYVKYAAYHYEKELRPGREISNQG